MLNPAPREDRAATRVGVAARFAWSVAVSAGVCAAPATLIPGSASAQGVAASAALLGRASDPSGYEPQTAGRTPPAWYFGGGVRFLSVLGTSAAVEITRAWDNGRGNTRGWTATAEVGQGGTELFVGRRHSGTIMNAVALGPAYVRTDDDARGVSGDQAFLGPELRITLLGVGVSMGYFWRVDGSAEGESKHFDASLLIGIW